MGEDEKIIIVELITNSSGWRQGGVLRTDWYDPPEEIFTAQ